MKLLIVESPSKAKTIEKYLDGEYVVRASVGHVRDLPSSNKKAIDIPAGFIPYYEISKGKDKVVRELQTLAEGASEILLATDPDREGEAISWHLNELLKEDKKITKNIKRVAFNEITKEAILEALKNPREIDANLVKAQEARRVLDRLVGYDLSGLIWKKVRYGLSAGRVQSPPLRIIMEREREIRAFLPQKFWTIEADLRDGGTPAIPCVCSVEPTEKKEVERILELGNSSTWQVTDIKETQIARSPKAPFITSTLQQTARPRLGWSPSRTMSIAQRLYEAGYIPYMRTDSTNLGTQAKLAIQNVVNSKFGPEYFEGHQFAKKSKTAQEAHEAIRPTHLNVEMAGATEEQHRLYRLIWQRAVASQMKNAEVMRTKVVAKPSPLESDSQGEGLADFPDFWLNGSRILFDGWLKADPLSASEDVVLPKFKNGESLKLLDIRSAEKQTEPPARYSEAGLIKELEKRGIGRPSTYASIIKTLEDRGYVEKISKALHPTDVGEVVSSFLEDNFPSYISDSFTAEMEDELDEIASGDRTYLKTLKDFYTPFIKDVKAKEKIEKITNLGKAPAEMKCPTCGGEMIIKLGKGGKFYMFTACSRFPKCKFVKKDEEQERANSTGVQCPVCKNGFLSERRGRFGVFYSCSNYPDCKYAIKAKPTGNICKLCGSLMMDGTKTIPERCSDKTCPNHNPHKLDKSK